MYYKRSICGPGKNFPRLAKIRSKFCCTSQKCMVYYQSTVRDERVRLADEEILKRPKRCPC